MSSSNYSDIDEMILNYSTDFNIGQNLNQIRQHNPLEIALILFNSNYSRKKFNWARDVFRERRRKSLNSQVKSMVPPEFLSLVLHLSKDSDRNHSINFSQVTVVVEEETLGNRRVSDYLEGGAELGLFATYSDYEGRRGNNVAVLNSIFWEEVSNTINSFSRLDSQLINFLSLYNLSRILPNLNRDLM